MKSLVTRQSLLAAANTLEHTALLAFNNHGKKTRFTETYKEIAKIIRQHADNYPDE